MGATETQGEEHMTPDAPRTNCLVLFFRSLLGLHTCSWRYRTTHWTYTHRADEYHCNCGKACLTDWYRTRPDIDDGESK